jgi:hypothetical protein
MLYLFLDVLSKCNNSKKGSATVKSSLHILFSSMLNMHPPNAMYIKKMMINNAMTINDTGRLV